MIDDCAEQLYNICRDEFSKIYTLCKCKILQHIYSHQLIIHLAYQLTEVEEIFNDQLKIPENGSIEVELAFVELVMLEEHAMMMIHIAESGTHTIALNTFIFFLCYDNSAVPAQFIQKLHL